MSASTCGIVGDRSLSSSLGGRLIWIIVGHLHPQRAGYLQPDALEQSSVGRCHYPRYNDSVRCPLCLWGKSLSATVFSLSSPAANITVLLVVARSSSSFLWSLKILLTSLGGTDASDRWVVRCRRVRRGTGEVPDGCSSAHLDDGPSGGASFKSISQGRV